MTDIDLEISALYYAKARIEEGSYWICNRVWPYLRGSNYEFLGSPFHREILEFIKGYDSVEEFLYDVNNPSHLGPEQKQNCLDFRLNMIKVMLERRGVK